MIRVLLIDDEEPVLRTLSRLLTREGYACTTASNAQNARKVLEESTFEAVLSDVTMPGESGIDLVRFIKEKFPDYAVMMVTGIDDPLVAKMAIESGAYGYIIKPFEPNEVIINLANALRRRELELENRSHRARLEQMVEQRTQALQDAIDKLQKAQDDIHRSHEETIQRLSRAAEFRDNETAMHTERMSRYCGVLARKIGIDARDAELIRIASPLHDVGKLGTPDHILLKPGPLTAEEFSVMKQHCEIGVRILAGSDSTLLDRAALIAWTHHEKYDGTGYPRGLVGEAIPIEGRIAAIADVFDALTSKRVYKAAFSVEKSVEIMIQGRGKHFDALLLDLFLECTVEISQIKAQFADEET